MNPTSVSECLDNYSFVSKKPAFSETGHKIIRSTAGMEEREREKIINVAIQNYLNTKPEILSTLRDSRGVTTSGSYKKDEFKDKATASDISYC